ncbi:site-specific DNA-methyltransferase [Parachitinimonas caeni]|uniref:site-specific DNA-methyltransferase (adenine-specific) n=1 Tax=Parachitinimonas caeni TaxID=3031301 RepID=A0ABT7DV43_9NEIS|nr:site-specific DNA-methyltransferase [Parachitinimonas caeni]MDK2123699.1 site-specific DNA-methyltransferase [Parachitinimonas caeni]
MDTPKHQQLRDTLITQLQALGGSAGNQTLREQMAQALASPISEADYDAAKEALLAEGVVTKGRGKGGSLLLVATDTPSQPEQDDGFSLDSPAIPEAAKQPSPPKAKSNAPRASANQPNQVLSYRYDEKRKNNPHVGMVNTANDDDETHTRWTHDPHIDPELRFDPARAGIESLIDSALASGDPAQMQAALEQLKRMQSPYLSWAGKAERGSFEVDTVSLHVHERIDPATILAVIQKRIKDSKGKTISGIQPDLFHAPFENLPLSKAVDFYKHERDWANRLVAGDSLLVMNSLLQKEGMAGQVQMIYIDPPYGIKYGSNFQPFVNKRDVKDRKDEDLTQEPEMIKAFRDTWELGIHSYLTYLRDRLLLAKELLSETGSIFVQISDENLHHVRELLDEIFGRENFVSLISYSTTGGFSSSTLSRTGDYLLWFAKKINLIKFKRQFIEKTLEDAVTEDYDQVEAFNGSRRPASKSEKINPRGILGSAKLYTDDNPTSQGEGAATTNFNYRGMIFHPGVANHWKAPIPHGMMRLALTNRFYITPKGSIRYIRYFTDFNQRPVTNSWFDIAGSVQDRADPKVYVVQTSNKIIERCLLLSTEPGDLVLDPTCGSGTTAYVAEKWGRRWITCDTSRVAVTLAKQRLLTASYDYFELKYPQEGLRGGFIYKTVPHVTLKSIANNPEIDEIYARLHPAIDAALLQLNACLQQAPFGIEPYSVQEGGRAGSAVDFRSTLPPLALPSSELAPSNALLEWEVPFDLPIAWLPEALRPIEPDDPLPEHAPTAIELAFAAFHAARQAMQKAMDLSIASHADTEILYDQPQVSRNKLRITGPFTVEAVPFATVLALDEAEQPVEADVAVARSGETSRQSLWRDELLKTGIRGKGGQKLRLLDLQAQPSTRYIHAVGVVAETNERVAVSFGPEHAALEQRQVEIAMHEAGDLFPLPKLLVFCAFTFDPEAAKGIDNIKGIQALKVQMNTDLLTEDLKKGRASNESFWLMGQPDVLVKRVKGEQFQVEVNGFDYFDTKTGELKSGGKKNIAMWALDTDYDNRSLYPRQVFFPMASGKEGWYKLKKDIRAELDESLLDKFHGTTSLPFTAGENQCIAVKIVDDRGIESLKVIRLETI